MKNIQRRQIKAVIIGDDSIGKKCLILSYTINVFPNQIPKVLDQISVTVQHKEEKVDLHISYSSEEDFRKFQSLNKEEIDIFIVSFSLVKLSSLENIENFWIKEMKDRFPNVPYILVGLQSDLRDNQSDEMKMMIKNKREEIMKKIDAPAYVESSSRFGFNLKEVFQTAIMFARNLSSKKKTQHLKSSQFQNYETDCHVTCLVS